MKNARRFLQRRLVDQTFALGILHQRLINAKISPNKSEKVAQRNYDAMLAKRKRTQIRLNELNEGDVT